MDCFGMVPQKSPREHEQNMRKITIHITGYDNLIPTYPVADVKLKVDFAGSTMLNTEKVAIITNYNIPVDYSFEIAFDWDDFMERDKILSNPIIMVLTESPGTLDPSMYNLGHEPQATGRAIWQSVESVLELQEALLGRADAEEQALLAASQAKAKKSSGKDKGGRKKGGSADKHSKASGSSKSQKSLKSKKSSSMEASKKKKKSAATSSKIEEMKKIAPPSGPLILGIGSIDLLPIFLGNSEPVQGVLLKQYPAFFDDRMLVISKTPVINVSISIDEECICRSALNVTVESIFNIPNVLGPDLVYNVHVPLPSSVATNESFHLVSKKYKTEIFKNQKKLWPSMPNEPNPAIVETPYWINDNVDDVKNPINIDLHNVWNSYLPRIEFNYIKRLLLNADNSSFFKYQVSEFRKLPIEIYIERPGEENPAKAIVTIDVKEKASKGKKTDGKKSKKDKSSSKMTKSSEVVVNNEPKTDYLHLMGFVDVSRLLYPGVSRTRVMVPLRTYQSIEIEKETGRDDSFFIPKPPPPPPPTSPPPTSAMNTSAKSSKGKASKGKSKSSKDSKKSSKSSKGSKEKKGSKSPKGKAKGDMKDKLPPPPVPPVPSIQVYNEAGQITFVIVEIELNDPLFPPRDLEDLSDRLFEMIPQRPSLEKKVLSSRVAKELYRETIRSLTTDMISQYHQYKQSPYRTRSILRTRKNLLNDFMKYLKNAGVYPTYLASVTRAASNLASEHFCYTGTNSIQYQRFVAEIYAYLITEVNQELNMALVKPMPKQITNNMTNLLYYAKEATELKDYVLADRYLLQRICSDERNATYWYDYAIFYMSLNRIEDAFECAREALTSDANHVYSMLLYAMLLERKNRRSEAETCMLTIVLNRSPWAEGWGALHVLYQQHGNTEGMEMSEEMGAKYLSSDTYMDEDDFVWTTQITPVSLFYRTASLFIKMRLLDEAEIALSNEITSDPGVKEYFLAIIAYYRHDYCHCEQHINQAKQLHGSDFAVGSLRGHCLMHLNKDEEALEEYDHILLSYNRPDDIHMLYMYSSFASDKLKQSDKALQLMLQACKYGGTPLTWMGAGVLFLQKGDYLKAEECLSYANMLDNRLAEVWGYMVLIHICMGFPEQADMCYTQAIKNGLSNQSLLQDIVNARNKMH